MSLLEGSWATARYTRWRGASQARLDRIYVSGESLAQVTGYAVLPSCFSDHGLVQCTVKLGTKRMEAFGKRRWIMNAKILSKEVFIETVKQEIENLTAGPVNAVTWELFKGKIKAVATRIGQREAAQKKTKARWLTSTLRALVQADEEQPGEFRDDIKTIKKSSTNTWNNAIVVPWFAVENRELSMRLSHLRSLTLSTVSKQRNAINEVCHSAGVASGREEVAEGFFDYYADLFKQRYQQDSIPADIIMDYLPKVPPEIREVINTSISTEDCRRTIKKISKNKYTGPDDIISEFYQVFSEQLSPIVAAVFDDIKSRKLLSALNASKQSRPHI